MPHRFVIKKIKRFFIYRVLHIDDTPHRIALGLAIGIFVTWTPTLGLQMILTVLLSAMCRANKIVGIPFVWISNPVTALPLYGLNFLVGAWILPGEQSAAKFYDALKEAVTFSGSWLEGISAWWKATIEFFWPLWIGSIVVGLALALPSYVLTRYAVTRYRGRRARIRQRLLTAGKSRARCGDSKG